MPETLTLASLCLEASAKMCLFVTHGAQASFPRQWSQVLRAVDTEGTGFARWGVAVGHLLGVKESEVGPRAKRMWRRGTGLSPTRCVCVATEPASHASPCLLPCLYQHGSCRASPGDRVVCWGGKEARGPASSHCTSFNLDHELVRVVCVNIPILQMGKPRGCNHAANRYLSPDPSRAL